MDKVELRKMAAAVFLAVCFAAGGYRLYRRHIYLAAANNVVPQIVREQVAARFHRKGLQGCYRKEWSACIRDYDKALSLNPRSAVYYCNRGLAYLQSGRDAAAVSDFTRAVKLAPADERNYVARAAAYAGLADLEKAEEDTRTAAGLVAGKPEADFKRYEQMIFGYIANGEKQKALEFLHTPMGLLSSDWRFPVYRGILAWDAGLYDDAAKDFAYDFMSRHPANFYRQNKGRLACNMEKYVKPVVFKYIDALARGNEYESNLLKGVALEQLICPDSTYFSKAIALNPKDSRAYGARTEYYLLAENPRAVDDADRAVYINKQDPLAYMVRNCVDKYLDNSGESADGYASQQSRECLMLLRGLMQPTAHVFLGNEKALEIGLANVARACREGNPWACSLDR